MTDSFNARSTLEVGGVEYEIFRLDRLASRHDLSRLPYSLKILLENLLRHEDGVDVTADDIEALAGWDAGAEPSTEIAFTPSRVLLQDFTGVPAVVDLAAMRDAMRTLGGDPAKINPLSPVELVIDHSVQVDRFGSRMTRWPATPRSSSSATASATSSCAGASRRSGTSRWCRPAPASCTRSTWSTSPASSSRASTPAPPARIRTPWSAPTRTPPWSTAWACSAGASAGSRRRPRCSASPSRCSSPRSWASSSRGSSPKAPPPPTSCSPWWRCFARRAWSASSSSSSATGSTTCRSPTAPPSRTWRRSTERPAASSPSTRRASSTCASPAVPSPGLRWSRRTRAPRACTARPATVRPTTPTPSSLDMGTVEPCISGPKRPQDRITLRDAKTVVTGHLAAMQAERGVVPAPRARPWRRTGRPTSFATARW